MKLRPPRPCAALIAAGLAIAGVFVAVPQPVGAAVAAATPYTAVGHRAHLPAHARGLGATRADQRVNGAVALAARNPAALHRDALAVSEPRSRRFHDYLAPGAFAARYGPTASTINTVEAALRAGGLDVTSVSRNHLFVRFSGTASQAEAAFRTRLSDYRLAGGRSGMATTRPVSLPAPVASQVVSVLGLNTLTRPTSSLEWGSRKSSRSAVAPASIPHYSGAPKACPEAVRAAHTYGGLTDDQIAHAYGVDGLYRNNDLGAGQTVAVFELEPFATSDLRKFATCYLGATAATGLVGRTHVVPVDGGAGVGPGSGESILDVEDVAALAPGANLEVYEAPNTASGSMDEYNQIVQDDTAQVVTTSWGFCEADEVNLDPGYINVGNQLYEQAALQGQTVLAAAGDSGADSCAYQGSSPVDPTLSVGDPGTQPFVVGVGGTTITKATNPPAERVWNDGTAGGSTGGGVSSVWSAPSWQLPFNDTAAAAAAVADGGLQPCPQSADGSMCRENPDVSADADEYTGAVTIYMAEFGGWNTIGGTSSSAPLWAAILADISASSGCAANGPLGFAAPSLYAVAAVPAQRAASFNDVTLGNNDGYSLNNGRFFAAHAGYDMASGLGTPRVVGPHGKAGLAAHLCALAAAGSPPPPAVASVSPTVLDAHPAGPLTISGTGFTGAAAVSIGGYPIPATGWQVVDDHTIKVTEVPTAKQAGNAGNGPQDGTGRALVTVTAGSGRTSAVTPSASVLYVAGSAAAPVPSVHGVSAYGGPQAGDNTVTIFGSGFSDTGADQVTAVTVGGVPATYTVTSATELKLTVPAYSAGTTCAAGDDPVHDVCQAQVVVTNANGSSAVAAIHPPYSGAPYGGVSGDLPLPDCVGSGDCEIVPATTEYDYFPTPSITSITTTSPNDPTTWVSEQGDTIATIDGSGFDYLGLDWVDIGNPSNPDHQDFQLVSVTPTEIQVYMLGRGPTTEPVTRNVAVQTMGGLSAPAAVRYAGVPRVSSASPSYVPDTGGATLTVTGRGFQGVAPQDGGELVYFYANAEAATEQHSGYTATSDTSITATTPGNNPGSFIVGVCTITFCSEPENFKEFRHSTVDFYEPGDPVITSVSKRNGPASGGTKVVIHGHNLSDAVEVDFGKTATTASNAPEVLTNGSSTRITAVAPPGRAGATVPITVTTAESIAEGHPSARSPKATFHYTPSAPSAPRVRKVVQRPDALTVFWKPPASTGGHPVLRYVVKAVAQRDSPSAAAKRPPAVTVRTGRRARSARLGHLRGGWTYVVRVQAVNRLGRGRTGAGPREYTIRDRA